MEHFNVFITGGTSGIGLELARSYLDKGYRVGVCGRSLEKLPNDLRKIANFHAFQADVNNYNSLYEAMKEFTEKGAIKLNLVIANAGVYASEQLGSSQEDFHNVIKTHTLGIVHTFESALNFIDYSKNCHLVAMSSITAEFDYYKAPVYGYSKRAVLDICLSYHSFLNSKGVFVTCLMPGYIETQKLKELTSLPAYKKVFLTDIQDALKRITKGIEQKKMKVIFPYRLYFFLKCLSWCPRFIIKKVQDT